MFDSEDVPNQFDRVLATLDIIQFVIQKCLRFKRVAITVRLVYIS